jgi:hypothetical protein
VLSPWQKLLKLRNDQAYITMMVFDCKSFDKILENFGPTVSLFHSSMLGVGRETFNQKIVWDWYYYGRKAEGR